MLNNVPNELKAIPSWICWRYEINTDDPEGKPRKVPYDPKTGWKASTTNSATWAEFNFVAAQKFNCVDPCDGSLHPSLTGYSGAGFVLSDNDPYAFIDLDDCLNDPAVTQRQMEIYSTFDSYAEHSPSGKGLHIIVRGKIPLGRRKSFVEIYSTERYMTMTGEVYSDKPIKDHNDALNALWEQMGKGVALSYYSGDIPERDEDATVIKKALAAQNGEKFKTLLEGRWSDLYQSQSEADFAFMDILAFYTQNRIQLKRMFLASSLGQRDKAKKHKRYVDYMIEKSFDRMLPPVDIEGLGNALQLDIESYIKQPVQVVAEEGQLELALPNELVNPYLDVLPQGLIGEIAEYVYASSPRPVPEVALGAAIGLMGGIIGRSYNISRTGLNQYVLVLAPTGSGKEALHGGIARLMQAVIKTVPGAHEFVGPSMIASGQALVRYLAKKSPCFVSVIGEVGLMLSQISGKYANSSQTMLRKFLLELYQKSGEGDVFNPSAYADVDKDLAAISRPAFSLLGESTPENFYKLLDEGMVSEGFLPRFTVIEYTGKRPKRNKAHADAPPPFNLIDKLGTLAGHALSLKSSDKVIHVKMTEEAQEFADSFDEFADHQINSSDTEVVRHLWNRAHLKMLKLAAICAVGCEFYHPVVTLDQMKWAHSLVSHDIFRLLGKFERGETGMDTQEIRQLQDLKKAIVQYLTTPLADLKGYSIPERMYQNKVIPYSYLQRRLMAQASFRKDERVGPTQAIRRSLQALIDAGLARELPPGDMRTQFNSTMKAYSVTDFKRLL